MKVLITGASGQLGRALSRIVPVEYDLHAYTHAELDITDRDAVSSAVRNVSPALVINAAAYTAVDKAESERHAAFAVNADGAENLALAARATGARFIHVSTDFVFDGTKSRPYRTSDALNPLGVYGASKAEGEARVHAVNHDRSIIVRTGWVYASVGRNFVNTILRLIKERSSLNVIADQVGTPTWATSLAELIWTVAAKQEIAGSLHWSDAGVASWYDFAVAIQEEAIKLGLIERAIPIIPINSEQFPLPAKRPSYSVLDKESSIKLVGISPAHWRKNLRSMLKEFENA